jgi:hypothetical protein
MIFTKAEFMIIRYSNGFRCDAILLSRTEDRMRVAIQGADDVVELTQIHGAWISDDCEPVQVDFAWTRQTPPAETKLEDCICPPELAARLIELLFSGVNAVDAPPLYTTVAQASQHVV